MEWNGMELEDVVAFHLIIFSSIHSVVSRLLDTQQRTCDRWKKPRYHDCPHYYEPIKNMLQI